MKEKFSRALAASRAKNDEKMMNGTLASSDDGSDTEGELDSTAVEVDDTACVSASSEFSTHFSR